MTMTRWLIVLNVRNRDDHLEQRCLGFVAAANRFDALHAGFEKFHRDYTGLAAVPVNQLPAS